MKRFRVLFLSLMSVWLIVMSPFQASAESIRYWLFYYVFDDIYKLRYTYPADVAKYVVKFTASSGKIYENEHTTAPTGLYYLTCNGTYEVMFYNAAGTEVGNFQNIVTTQLKNPGCLSYPNPDGRSDIPVTKESNPDGSINLSWPKKPERLYDVVRDGQIVKENDDTGQYSGPDGDYQIREKDSSGNITGVTDVPGNPGGTSDGGGTGEDGGSGGTDPPGGTEDCATKVCACVAKLETVLNSIDQKTDGVISAIGRQITATQEVKQAVDEVKNAVNTVNNSVQEVKTSVDKVKEAVDSLHDEFVTDKPYPIKDLNSYPAPNLEDDKPPMHDTPIRDDNVYFTDQGDAEETPAFPLAPEPVTSWETGEGDETVSVQPGMTKDQQEQKEPDMQRQPETTKEPDTVRQPDQQRDAEMKKDDEQKRDDEVVKEQEVVTQPVPSKSPVLQRDPEPQKIEMPQTLRWKSGN